MLIDLKPSQSKVLALVGLIERSFISRSYLTLLDIEENGVRLRLTVVDTPGFGDFVNNDDRSVF